MSEFSIDALVRPNIRALKPYKSARDSFEEGLLMDANELPSPPDIEEPDFAALELNRYPSPHQRSLRHLIARFRGISEEQVFVGVGSDEAIDLLLRIFCRPGQDQIMVTPPSYGMYQVVAHIHDVEILEAPLDKDFQLHADRVIQHLTDRTKLIFLCSPNNPTGNLLDPVEIEKILHAAPGLVVIDEAYIDFADQPSWASRLKEYDNLVVLQTMSKSFGLAGIRLGWALAQPQVIEYMMRVKAPYNVNKLTSATAISALQDRIPSEERLKSVRHERERLSKALQKIPAVKKVYSSHANFILFKIQDALSVYQQLADQGIIIRYRGDLLHCEDCLRTSVGTPEQNNRLIAALNQLSS
ncbi:MAG: histidinol-phosphate transaminase [Bacteroidota bacterium]